MPSHSAHEPQCGAGEALPGCYFDGVHAQKQAVTLQLTPDGIGFITQQGEPVFWPSREIHRPSGPDDRLILACGEGGARVHIHDQVARRAVLQHIGARGGWRGGAGEHRRLVFWLIAATVSIMASIVFLIPALADRIAPLVPARAEIRLGEMVDRALRERFDLVTCESEGGDAALAQLTARLTALHDLHVDPQVGVVARDQVNAVALPGGQIYVFAGLLKHVDGPDALAGVIAHEIGHVAHRDGLRNLIRAGGTGFLMGLFFGDFIGGGVMAGLAQASLMASHSRQQELAADRFAAQSLRALGRPTHPFAGFLLDLGAQDDGLFATHPMGEQREGAVRALGETAPVRRSPRAEAATAPLLADAQWSDLRAICDGGAQPGAGADVP